jgi:hypothetical protein
MLSERKYKQNQVVEDYTDRYLEVNKFFCIGAHLIVETELVLADFVGGEYKIALTLFLSCHNDFPTRASHLIVDIEGPAGLYLA